MPIISPQEALAALDMGMKDGGYDEFSVRIADDPKMFGDVVFYALKRRHPQWDFIRLDDLRFKVSVDAERSMVPKLHRFFNMLNRHDAQDCLLRTARVIADFDLQLASLNGEAPSDEERTLDKVVALLKSRQVVDGTNAEMSREPRTRNVRLVTWEVVDGVMASAAFDNPDKFAFLTTLDLEKLGIGAEEVREAAIENIRRAMADMGLLDLDEPLVPVDGGVVGLGRIGGFASSILLVDDFWKRQVELCGEPLSILPRETDEILVWRSSDLESTAGIFLALLSGQERGMLANTMFVFGSDGLSVFDPDAGHESVARMH